MTRASAANRPAACIALDPGQQARCPSSRSSAPCPRRRGRLHRSRPAGAPGRSARPLRPADRPPRRGRPAGSPSASASRASGRRRAADAGAGTIGFRLPKAIEWSRTRTLPSDPRCGGERVEDRRHAVGAERVQVQAEEPVAVARGSRRIRGQPVPSRRGDRGARRRRSCPRRSVSGPTPGRTRSSPRGSPPTVRPGIDSCPPRLRRPTRRLGHPGLSHDRTSTTAAPPPTRRPAVVAFEPHRQHGRWKRLF